MKKVAKKWTQQEDDHLVRQVKAFPQNLHRCFMIVAEETGRSEKAVAAHWYTKTSKRPDVMYFFTASPKHVSKNRKNGMEVSVAPGIWRRFLNILRSL